MKDERIVDVTQIKEVMDLLEDAINVGTNREAGLGFVELRDRLLNSPKLSPNSGYNKFPSYESFKEKIMETCLYDTRFDFSSMKIVYEIIKKLVNFS